jgi:hypothetical protein
MFALAISQALYIRVATVRASAQFNFSVGVVDLGEFQSQLVLGSIPNLSRYSAIPMDE